ncbi:Cobalamin synthesis protein cobW C-terminal domain-containing protein [Rubrimonas cliftonensis]|uniref:Cobalamin synthesis protein cobW C-terminal domain-containing protein n=2 Tax=Rubrimonas cliftonensis TaxID=89524 RepID=A0A1H4EYY7_9RHOB|nr:Cobalamin synthesis protein cobW C-terminal domain-containing protein [Rubrimonas cliftonensis]
MALTTALELPIANQSSELLRLNDVGCSAAKQEPSVMIPGAQHVFHDPGVLNAWPNDDRRTHLVFITQGVGHALVNAYLRARCDIADVRHALS